MPTVTATKNKKQDGPRPTLGVSMTISGTYSVNAYPSTFTSLPDTATADEVLSALREEYDIGRTDGALAFLYDQSWFDQMALEITITMEDIRTK